MSISVEIIEDFKTINLDKLAYILSISDNFIPLNI